MTEEAVKKTPMSSDGQMRSRNVVKAHNVQFSIKLLSPMVDQFAGAKSSRQSFCICTGVALVHGDMYHIAVVMPEMNRAIVQTHVFGVKGAMQIELGA